MPSGVMRIGGRALESIARDPSWLDRAQHDVLAWARSGVASLGGAEVSVRHALRWAAHHTGLPVVVVAALALVLAFRIAKRTWHVALELAVAAGLLLAATKLGWIRW
jgi:hypothetical protein